MPAALADTRFRLSHEQALALKKEFGTPLYVIDESHFRARIQRYRSAFSAAYTKSQLTFASKANSTLAVLAIAAAEGCLIDVASEGEFRAALRAGCSPRQCHLHGNNKSVQELQFAISQNIGQIVVDNFGEIEKISQLTKESKSCPDLVLRLAPGVDPVTHAKISTGQADTKFGFNIADGSAEAALAKCLAVELPVVGIHCHVGSQLLDPEAQRSGGAILGGFARDMKHRHGFDVRVLNIGGGLGVRYLDSDSPMEVEEYCRLVVEAVMNELSPVGLAPELVQEPGRSLVAESGATLYEVGVIKTVPSAQVGKRTYVCVDGGLSDNPRPVMYGSKYTVLDFHNSDDRRDVRISGKHCETDTLFDAVALSSQLVEGDLIQVLCTGAYNSTMASNYNRFPRPASVLIRSNGDFQLVQARDDWDSMFQRESVPEDLIH
ncbi:MAG: diaminopimelate decarboxylase [Armatimonadetes bacterium]|nr:diaminopimelate decarboxylase [Armatimonadota bacterium]